MASLATLVNMVGLLPSLHSTAMSLGSSTKRTRAATLPSGRLLTTS
jgi:hypothetical protein